jgi:hypothetical protein
MTLVYRFTQSATSGSVSGTTADHGGSYTGTPWDTGRTGVTSVTRPTTRAGIWDVIDATMTAAGWTATSKGTRDSVYTSTGESGNENWCVRITLSSGQFINFAVAPKVDASNNLQGAIGVSGTNAQDRWNLTASDFTADFHFLANKDWIIGTVQNTSHASTMFTIFLGGLSRAGTGNNTNVLISSGSVSAGSFVSIACTANPLTAGYRPGDIVQIVATNTADSAFAERVLLVDVTTTAVVARTLTNNYSSGTRIGMLATPIARCVGNDTEFDATGTNFLFTSPYMNVGLTTNDLCNANGNSNGSGQLFYEPDYSLGDTTTQTGTEYGTGASGTQNRTLRFTCRAVLARVTTAPTAILPSGASSATGRNILGIITPLFAYPGTPSYYPHDNMQFNRQATPDDYVPLRFTQSSAIHFVMGPTPH